MWKGSERGCLPLLQALVLYTLSSYTQMNKKFCGLYLLNRLWHFVKLWIVLKRAGIMHSPPF